MNLQRLKDEIAELDRRRRRLTDGAETPTAAKVLRLRRRADELDRKVSRAEELQEMRDQLREA